MRPRKKKIPPPDERVLRSKKAVLAATYALLSEGGLGGVSVDEVAKRSGVAKTTIYRHWPSRSALVLDACAKMASRLEPPETGSLRGDLEFLAAYVAGRLPTALWASVLPSIIDAAERDPQLAAVQARIHSEMRNVFRLVIERAQQRGEISRSVDSAEIIAAILGPLFYRRWFSREPLNEQFVKGVVARAIAASSPS